jgi:hypothetical protein
MPTPAGALFVLLAIGAAAEDPLGQLWSTPSKCTEFDELSSINGSLISAVHCSAGCASTQQQRFAVVDGGVYYTLRNKMAFVFSQTELHGFNLNSPGSTAPSITKLDFKLFSGSFAEGVWGLTAAPRMSDTAPAPTQIFAIGPTKGSGQTSGNHSLVSIFPNNHTVRIIGSTVMYPAASSSSAYDPEAQVFYCLIADGGAGIKVRGLSTLTGKTVFDMAFGRGSQMYSLDYVPSGRNKGTIVGLGLDFTQGSPSKPPHQYRTLQALDVRTKTTKRLMNLTDYAMNLPPTALAVHQSTGENVLTAIMVPQNSEAGNLVSLNIDTLSVVSEPQLCTEFDRCPFTLGWLQKQQEAVSS